MWIIELFSSTFLFSSALLSQVSFCSREKFGKEGSCRELNNFTHLFCLRRKVVFPSSYFTSQFLFHSPSLQVISIELTHLLHHFSLPDPIHDSFNSSSLSHPVRILSQEEEVSTRFQNQVRCELLFQFLFFQQFHSVVL